MWGSCTVSSVTLLLVMGAVVTVRTAPTEDRNRAVETRTVSDNSSSVGGMTPTGRLDNNHPAPSFVDALLIKRLIDEEVLVAKRMSQVTRGSQRTTVSRRGRRVGAIIAGVGLARD